MVPIPRWQEDGLAVEFMCLDRKSVQPAQILLREHLPARARHVTTITKQQQKAIAIAAGKNQIVQHQQARSGPLPRFTTDPVEHGDLVGEIKLLQWLVAQVT